VRRTTGDRLEAPKAFEERVFRISTESPFPKHKGCHMSVPPDEQSRIARQVLVQVLKEDGTQLGAKLKLRLTAALGHRLGVPRDAWPSLVPRLSHLLAANADVVEVFRPNGPGDIRVSLRQSVIGGPEAESESPKVWYRPDVWAAFVNPDPNRRRFLHRATLEVVHFLTQSDAPPNPQLSQRVAKDANFVEIQFANADLQQAWLRDFLVTTPLIPDSYKRVAQHFVNIPFDTSVKAAFVSSLGPHGDAWRRFRAQKINELIMNWAGPRGVDPTALRRLSTGVESTASAIPQLERPGNSSGPRAAAPTVGGDSRSRLIEILDALDDAELKQVLIPLSAAERILRHRA
jgi:hypothetical protein